MKIKFTYVGKLGKMIEKKINVNNLIHLEINDLFCISDSKNDDKYSIRVSDSNEVFVDDIIFEHQIVVEPVASNSILVSRRTRGKEIK